MVSLQRKKIATGLAAVLFVVTAAFLAAPLPEAKDQAPSINLPSQLEWVGMVRNASDIAGKPSRLKRMMKAILGLDDRQKLMYAPYGVAVDSEGRMIVADTKGKRVHIFDERNSKYKTLLTPGSDYFQCPVGVAVDAQDNIYVSDSVRSRVFVFRKDGKYLKALGTLPGNETIFKRSTGIAIDSQRRLLYVVDTIAMQVFVLTLDGKVVNTFGQRGDAIGEFNFPTQVAVAPDGSFWVTDSLNFRIQHFAQDGKAIAAFGRLGDSYSEFDKAKGIALDSHGNLYVVEGRNDRVQVYSPEGRFLFYFGGTGDAAGQFYLPTGIAVDHENRIYVSDSQNGRVEIFRLRPGSNPSEMAEGL